jgi:heptosyltransferase I
VAADRLVLEPPREVAIVMLSALGDAVHVLPVANALKRAWPSTRLTWVIQPVPHQLVRGHPAVDEFVLFRRRRGAEAWRSYTELSRALAGRRFGLLINLQVYLKAGLITAVMKADVKLGFDRRRARDMNWLFTTHRIPPRATGHVQDQYLEFSNISASIPTRRVAARADRAAERAAQREFFAGFDRSRMRRRRRHEQAGQELGAGAVCAAARGSGSRLRHARRSAGRPLIGRAAAAEQILRETHAHPVDALADDVRRLLWLLDGCDLVISPDTGPLHIARAMDRPSSGCTATRIPKRYGPYGRPEQVVDGYARFVGEDYELNQKYRVGGMERITVEMVLAAVDACAEPRPGCGVAAGMANPQTNPLDRRRGGAVRAAPAVPAAARL